MNNNILDDLFFGEITPNRWKCDQTQTQKLEEYENKLIETLKNEEKSLFYDYTSTQSKIIAETALKNFKSGFKLGCRIMIESLTGSSVNQ